MEQREQELARLIEEQRRDDTAWARPEYHGGDHGLPVLSLERVLEHGLDAVLTNRDGRKRRGIGVGRIRDKALMQRVAASGRCWRCGGPGEEADHLVPECEGGETVEENLAPACVPCNRYRKNGRIEQRALDLAVQQGYAFAAALSAGVW